MTRHRTMTFSTSENRNCRVKTGRSARKVAGRALAALVPVLLAGCTFIPDYERPSLPVPAAYPEGAAYQANVAEGRQGRHAGEGPVASETLLAAVGWHDFFQSPELKSLIGRALTHNRDLREAALNIEIARAQYRVTRSDLLPDISADAEGSRMRVPRKLSETGRKMYSESYTVNPIEAAYEIDFFGRIRSLSESALHSYLATEEARNTVQVMLIAEVANAYLSLLADRQQLELSDKTLKAQQASFDLAQRQFDKGIGSKLDLRQAQTFVETARVDRIAYTRIVAQDMNALSLLVGAPVTEDDTRATFLEASRFVADLPVGLPSDLLQSRPDIRQAEHALMAQNANIGAARAAFFPTVSLTGSYGTGARDISDLFSSGTATWSYAPRITLPIFTGGLNRANLDIAELRKNVAIAQYERAIQVAFREVADALAARGTIDDQIRAQRALVDATQEAYSLSNIRYNEGVDNYLVVLDSQRSLYGAQQQLIATELGRLSNLITLYRVLGGGVAAESAAPIPASALTRAPGPIPEAPGTPSGASGARPQRE